MVGMAVSFLFLALGLAICLIWLGSMKTDQTLKVAQPALREIFSVLSKRSYASMYTIIFCCFFVFSAVLNFLPFRLVELNESFSEFRIGTIYIGYVAGVVTALLAMDIARLIGGEGPAIAVAVIVLVVSLFGWSFDNTHLLFINMFVFSGAMFLVHALVSGLLNHRIERHKGAANGVYVAVFYGGGVLGSSVPGLAYRQYGWEGLLIWQLPLTVIAFIATLILSLGDKARE
ncbi:MAG: hypothetical protein MI924_35235 [Chloroflexales bacterium]|nr:hypothetical protein [Chloroflexales bacterium]